MEQLARYNKHSVSAFCDALIFLQEEEQQSHAQRTVWAALPAQQGRRLSSDDALRVRRRNDEMFRRRLSCSNTAIERAARQEARSRQLAQQV